jgi:hypothetical protein
VLLERAVNNFFSNIAKVAASAMEWWNCATKMPYILCEQKKKPGQKRKEKKVKNK